MNTNKADGGPAFPVVDGSNYNAAYGMSLRDWFATHAREDELILPGTVKESTELLGVSVEEYTANAKRYWYHIVTKARYEWADAMIAEREK